MAENFLIRFQNLGRRLFIINFFRRQTDELFFAFAGQQLHRAVAAGKLLIDIAIENEVRGSIEKRAQERGLLFKFYLRLLAPRHFLFQFVHHQQTRLFRFDTVGNLLI